MQFSLSSFSRIGLDALPVDVVVDEDRAKVVEPGVRRVLHSVRLEMAESASSVNPKPPDGPSELPRGIAVNRSTPSYPLLDSLG
jgi:hypothetical protein